MYRVPIIKTQMVRDGSLKVASKKAEEPRAVAEIAGGLIGDNGKEHFLVLLVDVRNKVTGVHVVSIGTLTASMVHPREVFRPAILGSAASIIIAHNHPSANVKPSAEDRSTTTRIAQAGKLLGIPLLDHVIFHGTRFFSFREQGLL